MPQERYKHIFLPGPTRTQGFTSPRKGRGATRFPSWDRVEHSTLLQQHFQQAWRDAEQRQAVSHVERRGTYIEFVSKPGFDLTLKSLENLNSGIRLLNVQRRGDPGSEQTLATVYIPNGRRSYFLNKIRAYAEEDDLRNNKPKNEKLVSSISDIRLSVLESFWQDNRDSLPGDTPTPVEVWLSSDDTDVIDRFNGKLSQLQIQRAEGALRFPERSVEVILASRNHLQALIEGSDDVAEFRAVSSISSFLIALENKEQLQVVRHLLERSTIEPETDVAICILDAGVNNGHLLIHPILDDDDLHTARASWGLADHNGHGTLMAGMAAYGDLLSLIDNDDPIRIIHRLESAKILPPPPEQNPKELWGYLTAQGLSRAEIQAPQRKRITCMAITSTEDRERGRPSSWSAKIDSLTSGYEDDTHRLIIISAGNVEGSDNWRNYPENNLTDEVHDPGQAWNALPVGAFTKKVLITDPALNEFAPIAPADGLSPYSTTSLNWSIRKWPIKPDLVLEGGNVARGPNDSIFDSEDMKLISTYHDPQIAQFAPFCATSAASAQAAWMAAQIQARYRDAWPETIRALMVHTAQWTDTLKSQFLPRTPTKTDYARLLRVCGYGVPNLDDALYCAANSLTLISQAELQPFDQRRGRYVTRDMHLYKLPWPSDVLSGLGETLVKMRVTLSYFVEPGPGEIGWESRYRYASHGLRFEVNGPTELEEQFVQRVNKQARDEDEPPGTEGPGSKWTIGSARNVGSIHSDIWEGRAADLAASYMIAIYPTVGWWRERHHLNRWDKRCRYSLIVSIHTPSPEIDIYTPVALQIGLTIPVTIQTTR
jgi:hypothetical protein